MQKVYGPYARGNGWRVFIASGPGQQAPRESFAFSDEGEATAFAAAARKKAGCSTIESSMLDWFEWLRLEKQTRQSTIVTYRFRLNGLLAGVLDCQPHELTAAKAAALYLKYQEGRAADTHQGALAAVKAYFEYLRKHTKAIEVNPWADIDPRGRKNKRKPQHRIDDAVKLYEHLSGLAMDSDGALGVLIALVLGFRAHEVVGITKGDLDAGGTVLWAARSHEGKTSTATRPLKVPEVLRGPLMKRAELRSGRLLPYRPGWVRDNAKKLCTAAGVPMVGAQALRGTNATLALEAGLAPELVARSLGHTNSKITKASYALDGAGRSQQVDTVMGRLLERLSSLEE